MVRIVLASATYGVCASYFLRSLVDASNLLIGSRMITPCEREPVFLTPYITKWRNSNNERERQVHMRGPSTWTYSLGITMKIRSSQAFNKINNVAGRPGCRRFSGRMYSEGGVDINLARNKRESSIESSSARKLFAEVSPENLVKAIVYEAQKGFVNVTGKKKRFGDFLIEQVTSLGENDHLGLSLQSWEFRQSLSRDSKVYDQMEIKDRISLLNKVAQSLGFTNLQDLVGHDTAAMEASEGLQLNVYANVAKSNDGNPSVVNGVLEMEKQTQIEEGSSPHASLRPVAGIMYGSSEPVKLPDPVAKITSGYISGQSMGDPNFPDSSEPVPAKGRKVASAKKFQQTEKAKKSVDKLSKALPKSELDDLHLKTTTVKDTTASSKTFVIDEKWGLDMPMASVKCLSSPIRERLEENGFNTVRLLLQHFPRMYQNFQQAGQRVEDGQNLSFVGMIVQSRALPRGPSLGLVEVIVRSEVDEDSPAEDEEGPANVDDDRERRGRSVFLHLKRFYKGSRYANPWFLSAMAKKYPENAQVTVCGKVKEMPQGDHFEIREFNLELWDGVDRRDSGIVSAPELLSGGKPHPVYPGKGSVQPKTIEFCIQRILPLLSVELDPIPRSLREKFHLEELHEAYQGIHSPMLAKDAEVARQRLVFDEFFYLQLGMLLPRQELADKFGAGSGLLDLPTLFKGGVLDMEKWSPLTLKLVKSLSYSLTDSQIKAAGEVMWDLQRPIPMSRLLQGDVGCGKTIVACLALMEVLDAGYQGALMAPTEFLAIQHYQRIMSWFEKFEEGERPKVALLTGSTPVSKARAIRSGLESGEIALAVGTHSLISDSVKFSALRLAVIDEQHRFGVSQRGRLNMKVGDSVQISDSETSGEGDLIAKSVSWAAPHILAMSATPIPRTLALAMHGDMSLSQITELPPGRAETATYAIFGDKKGRQEVYKRVRKELEDGGRVFVVFPVIEESVELPDVRAAETEFKILEMEFKEFKFDLVHGRMRSHEKDDIMERFKSGETQGLVSTTVIEVGIDIPEASMIVIEHAERYGMAQLHQLRGRVGRGTRPSSCILLGSTSASLARLKLLEKSRDGFYLAEVDLKQRGPGDLLGKRQSGYLPDFNLARLEKDGDILEQARIAAEELLQVYPKLKGLPRVRHELSMRRPPASLA